MASMFNKLATGHCFGEWMCGFDRCFNLSFYLAACLCAFGKIIILVNKCNLCMFQNITPGCTASQCMCAEPGGCVGASHLNNLAREMAGWGTEIHG